MDYVQRLQEYRKKEIEVFQGLSLEDVNCVMNVLEKARESGKRIFICGNGGSASTASHYASDFNKGVNLGLLGIKSHSVENTTSASVVVSSDIPLYNFECLSDNISTLTAEANDESYDEVFSFSQNEYGRCSYRDFGLGKQ